MRRYAAVITSALCACLLAAPAASAATWEVDGAGYGHGIGMSQYGAYGFARHGWTYDQILAWYYKGTRLGAATKGSVRVLLASGQRSVTVSGAKQVDTHRLDPSKTYVAKASGSGVIVRDSSGKLVGRFTNPQFWAPDGGGVSYAGSRYRGAIEVRPGLMAINYVGLDDYVQGVVPGEMPSLWSPEALKAQAVAARTYALTTDAGGAVFDQYADTRSQVYRGMNAETPATNVAVRDTGGQVVTYRGQLATTYFFSTSGGKTENVENVFYGATPEPYLQSVADPYEGFAPRHRWHLRFSQAQIQNRLGHLCTGSFRGLRVLQRGASPRVVKAVVVCSRSGRVATGVQLRNTLGLYDSWFNVKKLGAKKSGKSVALVARMLFLPQP